MQELAPYFAGLLPEGRRLSTVRTAVKTSADDDLISLLGGSDLWYEEVVGRGQRRARLARNAPLMTRTIPAIASGATVSSRKVTPSASETTGIR